MKISEYIAKLQAIQVEHGDLDLIYGSGRYLDDDDPVLEPRVGNRRKDLPDILTDAYSAPEIIGDKLCIL